MSAKKTTKRSHAAPRPPRAKKGKAKPTETEKAIDREIALSQKLPMAQRDLSGGTVAPSIVATEKELVRRVYESEHFVLRTNNEEMARVRQRRSKEKQATYLARKVRPRKDLAELQQGEREEETTALVNAALVE